MPTAAERHALGFLAAVALIGGGLRVAGASRFARELGAAERLEAGTPDRSMGDRALAAQIAAVDSAKTAKSRRSPRPSRARRPAALGDSTVPAPGPKPPARRGPASPPPLVDVNRATATELERLPRVGPALAARIIAWRDQHGPFRSLDDLRHVRGIGPATVALVAPSVTF